MNEIVSSPGTLPNSFIFSVNTAQLWTIAVAAMIKSWAPMSCPCLVSVANRPACALAASALKLKTGNLASIDFRHCKGIFWPRFECHIRHKGMIISRPGRIASPSARGTGDVCSGELWTEKWYRTLRATWFKPFGMKSHCITPESKLMHMATQLLGTRHSR